MNIGFKLLTLTLLLIVSTIKSFGNDSIKSENVRIDSLLLVKSDLPGGYKFVDKEIPITNQASSLYNQIDMYSMILKIRATDKKYQSIKSSKDKGTAYYILFDSSADKAKGFAQGLIWGTKESNDEHPDEIIVKGKLMIVLSFNKDSNIKEIIKRKIEVKKR